MADSTMLENALNNLIVEARRLLGQIEAERGATVEAVPASLVNMPPETRAARPATVAAAGADQAAGVNPAESAPGASDKTAGASAVKAESDASKEKK